MKAKNLETLIKDNPDVKSYVNDQQVKNKEKIAKLKIERGQLK